MILLEYEFTNLEELYKRVKPALHSKELELERLGYKNIKEFDIWNYLKDKWKSSNDLTLADIVDDILNTDSDEINSYYEDYPNKNIKKDIEV